uniref:Fibroblast growth factor binding protein 3 n=1 Tax=Colobus angolensis palliatus TaxID=336983 RepID=A0A2K5HVD3_COLAP
MSPPRLRASLSPSLLLLLLLSGSCLLAAARREKGAAGNVVEPVPGPTGGSSGRFLSPEQHACSWQLLLPAPGAAAGSELALRCQSPEGRGRPRERAPGPAAGTLPPQSAPPKENPSERKTNEGKRKAALVPNEERPMGTGPDPDGLDGNAELAETYCAEKWHSLCNFFVNFWNG